DDPKEEDWSAFATTQHLNTHQATPLMPDEILAYLQAPIVSKEELDACGGVVKDWDSKKEIWPRLYRIASDFLSAPDRLMTIENYEILMTLLQQPESIETAGALDTVMHNSVQQIFNFNIISS
ncbi:hypothetical protein BT96DRAFT_948770, partial [Gymnopus androsaceus JB14]